MVFQQSNLMPWRTVLDNIKLPLEVINIDEQSARLKTQEMIELVGLQGFENSLPRDLIRRDGATRGDCACAHP